jgi:hypothetical protein
MLLGLVAGEGGDAGGTKDEEQSVFPRVSEPSVPQFVVISNK